MPDELETRTREDMKDTWLLAANCVLHENDVADGSSSFGSVQAVVDAYARHVLQRTGPDIDRLYAGARLACHDAADVVEDPKRFRVAIRAVTLFQRAAALVSALTEI